jgi:hypothetical protein
VCVCARARARDCVVTLHTYLKSRVHRLHVCARACHACVCVGGVAWLGGGTTACAIVEISARKRCKQFQMHLF